MSRGIVSPDGTQVWDGEKWVPIGTEKQQPLLTPIPDPGIVVHTCNDCKIMNDRKPFEWINEESITFLRRGYLSEGEEPLERIKTIADHAEKLLGIDGFADKFYGYMSKGWYSLSSPVWANFGKKRGLPVSCFGSNIGDNIESILFTQAEVGEMSKMGGGTSGYFGNLRGRGAPITDNGHAPGAVHFMTYFKV